MMSRLMMVALAALLPCTAWSEPEALDDVLSRLDGTEVRFAGEITAEQNPIDYHLKIESGERFRVRIDAGRDVRNDVEEHCPTGMAAAFGEAACSVSGSGFIEMVDGIVTISIVQVDDLSW